MTEQRAHQGEALRGIIKDSPYCVRDVANMLDITRRTVYVWLAKPVLSKNIIMAVGEAIDVDIFKAMPAIFGVVNGVELTKVSKSKEVPNDMADYWKDKYLKAIKEIDDLKIKVISVLNY